ncbi:MAG TPA: helix-turn-helix transcriptional regulator [Jiangellaceae bacterium]|nr:helix-turn-helix transcriptional regulator [Jiangellaceae bacterium]
MAMAPSVTWTTSRFQAGIERLCRSDLDARALLRALATHLRVAIPHQGLLLLRTDPTTVLPTDGVVEAIPPALCKPFWDNELLEDDLNKFVDLGRTGPVAATLLEATDGDLTRSRRYNALYRRLGVSDELRASFSARDGSCWGVAQLIRTDGSAFTAAERALLADAAPAVAAALRARFALGAPAVSSQRGPALVILDKSGDIESVTAEARQWLTELAEGSSTGMTPIPEPVYLVAGRARAARDDRSSGPACAQVRTVRQGWLHLHASCLDGPDGPGESVAVVITPARAPELMPLLALGYRLTDREQEVLQFLARGMSTAEMSQQLEISTHTVRDHIKALFGKVGVRSRAELLARIFAEHYFDRLEADVDRPEP